MFWEPRFVPFVTAFARNEHPESRAKRPKTTLGPKGGDRDAPCISIRILLHIWPPEGLRVEPQPNFGKLSCVLLIGLRVGVPWEGPGNTKARAKGPLREFRGTPSWLENAAPTETQHKSNRNQTETKLSPLQGGGGEGNKALFTSGALKVP